MRKVFFFGIGFLAVLFGGQAALDLFQEKDVFFESFSARSGSLSESFLPLPAPPRNFCAEEVSLVSEGDKKMCFRPPKISAFRLFELDLTNDRIMFYENGLLKKTFPIAYQAEYGKWFQTPTGYFEIGAKRTKLKSSIIPVYMEDAVQFYEDFFIHGIPYYEDGKKVSTQFSGGCIRLENEIAKDFFISAQKGDVVVSYLTFDKATIKEGFFSPVAMNDFWIRQRFNSPLKTIWEYLPERQDNYIQHAGVDFAPLPDVKNLSVYAVFRGKVEKIVLNGEEDAGLGNTVILSHGEGKDRWYSLYGHLDSIDARLSVGEIVAGGEEIGSAGNTGYGCDFWKIGEDGCGQSGEKKDVHLHLEIKSAPVLESPREDICPLSNGKKSRCVGYASQNPLLVGYQDPLIFLFETF